MLNVQSTMLVTKMFNFQYLCFPPWWDASESMTALPPAFNSVQLIYTAGCRGTVRVKCLTTEHITMSPAKFRTRIASLGLGTQSFVVLSYLID